MKNFTQLFITGLICLASSTALAGGGWPQIQGSGYFKLSQWWLISDSHFTDVGGIDPNITTGLFNTSLYGEYGFTDRLTGILYFPFFSRTYYNNTVSGTTGELIQPGESVNSIGDTDIALKYGLITKGPVVLSATLQFGLPLGESSGGSLGILQTGDGEFNQMLRMDVSTSYSFSESFNTYYSLYVGYNNRTNGFSDEFRFGIEAGAQFFGQKLLTLVRLYGTQSMNNGSSTDTSNSTSIFANNSEHLTVSPEIAVNIQPNWGLSASYAHVLDGQIIFADDAYSVGVFMTF